MWKHIYIFSVRPIFSCLQSIKYFSKNITNIITQSHVQRTRKCIITIIILIRSVRLSIATDVFFPQLLPKKNKLCPHSARNILAIASVDWDVFRTKWMGEWTEQQLVCMNTVFKLFDLLSVSNQHRNSGIRMCFQTGHHINYEISEFRIHFCVRTISATTFMKPKFVRGNRSDGHYFEIKLRSLFSFHLNWIRSNMYQTL